MALDYKNLENRLATVERMQLELLQLSQSTHEVVALLREESQRMAGVNNRIKLAQDGAKEKDAASSQTLTDIATRLDKIEKALANI